MSLMFLLPRYKLVQIYFHIFSLLLFSVVHHLSDVPLERNGDPDLKLDDFAWTKLERHEFHMLAQVCHLQLLFLIIIIMTLSFINVI